MAMAEKTETKEWVDWLPTKTLQKAVVTDKDGSILFLTRSETKPGARKGKKDLLGGSLNNTDLQTGGQLHEEALKREIKEESGLEVFGEITPICVRSGVKKTQTAGEVPVMCIGYVCRVSGVRPEVVLSDEHVLAEWVAPQDALQMDFGETEDGFHLQTLQAYLKNVSS